MDQTGYLSQWGKKICMYLAWQSLLVRLGQGYGCTLFYATDVVLRAYLHVTFFFPPQIKLHLKYQKRCLDIETFWLNYRFSMQTLKPDGAQILDFPTLTCYFGQYLNLPVNVFVKCTSYGYPTSVEWPKW